MVLQEAIKLLRLQLHFQNFQVVQDRLPMVRDGLVRFGVFRLVRLRHDLGLRFLGLRFLGQSVVDTPCSIELRRGSIP